MTQQHQDIDAEDEFRSAMADVQPLSQRSARKVAAQTSAELDAESARARREAAEGVRAEDDNFFTLAEVPLLAPRDFVEWKKDGVQHSVFQKLRLGQYPVEATLDLHRHTVKEARVKLFGFLRRAQSNGQRCVLVTHGRGERSRTPGRVKSFVVHWLSQHPELIAYVSADARHGGTGATFVLIRKSADRKEFNRERFGQKSDPGV